jgi:hypothetical protein
MNDIIETEEHQASTPARYFQRSQVNKNLKDSPQGNQGTPTEDKGSMHEVKRLLESLMSQKGQS